ncbi:hypothetical protein ACWOB1_05830 [Facklamia languida]|uniref:DUF5590 domain-containing protein n=1 Tax=Facklamia languida CCUG 37842 TaxID=883113 RepID=H3NKY0_9LACT|nr:hypothetical protein HMPREF9708_01519 [Facklamia languida CCUG 37842]
MLKRRTVSILTLLLILTMVALLSVFMSSQSSLTRAQEEALTLVNLDYQVKQVKDFYWTTTDQSYFAMRFVDQEDQGHYAIIERKGGDAFYYGVDELINEKDAKSLAVGEFEGYKVLQARLGMYTDQPAWEVALRSPDQTITYYTLNATTGKKIKTIQNI